MISVHVIVDACVAGAVGDPVSDIAAGAGEIVNTLKSGPVGVLMTDALLVEWENHASRYMRSWLAWMISRGRSRHEKDRRVSDYRRALGKVPKSQGRDSLLKDAHLLDAAILHGAAVMSLDDKQRSLLRNVLEHYARIGRVQWFNPISDCVECRRWLGSGGASRDVLTIEVFHR